MNRTAVVDFCIAFRSEFGKSPEMTWAQLQGKDAKSAFWTNVKEIIADHGSVEVLARSLETDGLSGTVRGLQMIQQGLAGYCQEKPGKNHPSGKFRIGTTYGANPVLRKVLGCKPQRPEPVTCTLEGHYPPK